MLLALYDLTKDSSPETAQARLEGMADMAVRLGANPTDDRTNQIAEMRTAAAIMQESFSTRPFWVCRDLLIPKLALVVRRGILATVTRDDDNPEPPFLWVSRAYGQDENKRPPVEVQGGPLNPDKRYCMTAGDGPHCPSETIANYASEQLGVHISPYAGVAHVNKLLLSCGITIK